MKPLALSSNNIVEPDFYNLEDFLTLPTPTIEKIIQKKSNFSKKSIVFAYDGTRRSFLIEEGLKNLSGSNPSSDQDIRIDYNEYSRGAIKKFLYHLVMMFEHGISTIVYPMWFCTLEKRGEAYLPKFIQYLWGLCAIVDNHEISQIFKEAGIKVIFYGEWRELLERGKDFKLIKKFEEIMESTKENTEKVVLLGTNIQDPSTIIIKQSIDYFQKFGTYPTKEEMIKQYYGVEVEDVSMYIGFDKFSTDGRPILISDKGNEDLYYTVSPHSFFTTFHFRKILYDHIFNRTVSNAKEYELKVVDVELMKSFYQRNNCSIMGVGTIQSMGNYWYPLPEIILPTKSLSYLLLQHQQLQQHQHQNQPNQMNAGGSTTPPRTPRSPKGGSSGSNPSSPIFESSHASPQIRSRGSSQSSSSQPTANIIVDNGASESSPILQSVPCNRNLSPSLLLRMQPFLQSN
eukprot:gene3301-4134_t